MFASRPGLGTIKAIPGALAAQRAVKAAQDRFSRARRSK